MSETTSNGSGSGKSREETRHPMVVAAHERLDRLHGEITRLGLERNIVELEIYGYTVVHDAMPMAFFDELRETIMELGEQDRAAGKRLPLAGAAGNSYLVAQLAARGRVFERAIMSEKPLTLVTYLLGESCQLSSCHGHVRVQGDPPQSMHIDVPLVPEPVPPFVHTCNMMWCTDEFTRESGGTLVVPGSHKRGVHPLPGESSRKMAIPVDVPKGSMMVFSGNLWHCAGARTIPGERVGMTCYFSRMYARPQEPLDELVSDEAIARNPPRFAELVGRYNPYPARGYTMPGDRAPQSAKYFAVTQDPRG